MATAINQSLPPPKQIRFVNNQGQPPSKRRRINAACLTCRKRKTRCAGEKPVCSTCTKNGHDCLGYNDLVERKRDGENGPAHLKFEPSDTTDLSAEPESEFVDEDDEDERRHWKSKPLLRTASFVDRDAKSRHDSAASAVTPATRPRGRSDEWDQDDRSRNLKHDGRRQNAFGRHSSFSEDGRSSNNRSPAHHHKESHRMPYFRYFGPTAIVPGYKQMVVNVSVNRDRRRSRGSSFSTLSPGNFFGGYSVAHSRLSHPETILETLEDLPVYDTSDQDPVHELIITLIKTFFLHLGCNYPFLKEARFLRMVKEKRAEPILVDAICALAARFSDLPIFTNDHDGRVARSEYGHIFAQRAKAATVDTFPCPSVAAVQACLLMAYEGFGEDQDSALWMYLGLAIRMAVDLGLQRKLGIQYQGLGDTWYTRSWNHNGDHDAGTPNGNQDEHLSTEEQKELEEERTATFWAVFVLDRVISSGTGRPVTFRDHDYDLEIPPPRKDPATGLADPLPAFIEIIHLYGRVSDVLNNIHSADELTEEKMAHLAQMESDLTQIYQKQDGNLHFSAVNFREYVKAGHGTTFILLHFWFHALIIVLHEPTLTTGSPTRARLLPNSRELCMSSAKTIADILAFAELIDPKSFIGNPFTSQPMYIAACAFLVESASTFSGEPSPETNPSDGKVAKADRRATSGADVKVAKHSLLASAANQNYQRCYKSLEQLHQYWGGVKYILVALDEKSKGNWDCETFTVEEYDSAIKARRGSLGRLTRLENPASPNIPPIAWSLTGTTNSPNSNLTLLYQNSQPAAQLNFGPPPPQPSNHSIPVSAPTPPGNMIYDPIRQSDSTSMFPPAYPQPTESAVRHQAHPSKSRRQPASIKGDSMHNKYDTSSSDDMDRSNTTHNGVYVFGGMSQSGHGPPPQHPAYSNNNNNNNHNNHNNSHHGPAMHNNNSPRNSYVDSSSMNNHHQQHTTTFHAHTHPNGLNHHHHNNNNTNNNNNNNNNNTSHGHNSHSNNHGGHNNNYEADFAQSGLASGSYSYFNGTPINEIITFDSQEINIDALGLQNEMMPPWLEILPGDVLGLFETGLGHGGHGGHME